MIYSDEVVSFNSRKNFTNGLNLSESDVSVTYTRYVNNYKKTTKDAKPSDKTIDDAVKDGLTPGKKIMNKNIKTKIF